MAFHEAGHTIIGCVLDEAEMVHKVTIVPRGQAGGYAMMLPKEDRYFMTEPELLDKIVGLLGGRVSEEINFGEASTGAHNDFQRATSIARKMVTEYGMSKKLGPLQFGSSDSGQVFLGKDMQSEPNYSDQIAYEIDSEVQRIIKEQYERCKQILTEHKSQLELIAKTLLVEETLVAEQIHSLFNEGKLPEVKYDDSHLEEDNEPDEDKYEGDLTQQEGTLDVEDDKIGKSYEEVKKEESHNSKDEPESDEEKSNDEPAHKEEPNIDDLGDNKPTDRKE